jgi:hypothetical protein
MFKQALALALANPPTPDLARAYCKKAAELAGALQGEEARRIEFYSRLVPIIVALHTGSAKGKAEGPEDKRARLEELRQAVESLRDSWQQRRVREYLELLVFAAKALVEEGVDADHYETLTDTETLLGLCRGMLRGKGNETRAYLRPCYDAALAAKLRLNPPHVKELLEIQWEATRGQAYQKDASAAPVLALYLLGEKCYLFLDVPRGASKSFCLADDYRLQDLRAALRADRLALPREVTRELQKLAAQGAVSVRCWWRDPLLDPEFSRTDGGEAVVQSTGFRGLTPAHFPFKLPEGVTEAAEVSPAPPRMAEGKEPKP